jgi:oligopeptide transport system permease protein
LLSDGQKNFRFLPYQMVYPAIVISVLMISFNLLADGLRDAFDPRTTR